MSISGVRTAYNEIDQGQTCRSDQRGFEEPVLQRCELQGYTTLDAMTAALCAEA